MKKIYTHANGQMLVTLLFFMVISITIVSAAVIMIIVNASGATSVAQGVDAYYIAESGIENGVLRLLRNPSYTGEVMTVSNGTATITVTGTEPKTVTSVGRIGDYVRTIRAVVGYTNNILTVQSWREI